MIHSADDSKKGKVSIAYIVRIKNRFSFWASNILSSHPGMIRDRVMRAFQDVLLHNEVSSPRLELL